MILSKNFWWDQLDVPWDLLPWKDLFDRVLSHTSDTPNAADAGSSYASSDSKENSRHTSSEKEEAWKDKPVEAPFMDAGAYHLDFEILCPGGCLGPRQSKVGKEISNDIPQHLRAANAESTVEAHQPTLTESKNHEKKSRFLSNTILYIHHPRRSLRSLDEAADRFFTYSTLAERNKDQVVTRFLRNLRKYGQHTKWPVEEDALMVVDQLWLWVLDEDTVVTCFPSDPTPNPDETKLDLEALVLGQIKRKCWDGQLNAERLASHIIYRSFSIFTHRHVRNPNLRFIDIFEKSISEQRANSTDLFRALEIKKKSGSFLSKRSPDSHKDAVTCAGEMYQEMYQEGDAKRRNQRRRRKDVFNLQEDIEAVGEVRDINEELHIMLRIVEQQMHALERTRLPKWEIWKEDLTKFKTRLEGLSGQTKDINELLIQTLELKQAQLSVRQNQVSLIFTVVTIVFLPLGLISSIFGMNATEFSDGSPVGLRRIFTYMFTIGVVLSGFALFWAFEPDIMDIASVVSGFWHAWKEEAKDGKGKRRLWPFSRKRHGVAQGDTDPEKLPR
ncbi:hypothetical protein BU23DRAFT_644460 [Bimuria novae-zelandiae CBS 107.79]|uniref:Cora-domain-containing protein n=1 Tax=Bimuria novae-zelandiae CBS 107.79 TaxID=1447943 RepID=A0A6A5V4Q6_9PLEO|nr:hypothetical protein BU23DRAFT_644460 [Bimuria novae-zelandiae CBS 107.79]